MNTVVDTYGLGSEHLGSYYHNGEEVRDLKELCQVLVPTFLPLENGILINYKN